MNTTLGRGEKSKKKCADRPSNIGNGEKNKKKRKVNCLISFELRDRENKLFNKGLIVGSYIFFRELKLNIRLHGLGAYWK